MVHFGKRPDHSPTAQVQGAALQGLLGAWDGGRSHRARASGDNALISSHYSCGPLPPMTPSTPSDLPRPPAPKCTGPGRGRRSDGHRVPAVVLPLQHEDLLSRDGDQEAVLAEHHCGAGARVSVGAALPAQGTRECPPAAGLTHPRGA